MNADKIYDFLLQPYVKALGSDGVANKRLIFTALQETFVTYLKLSFFSALFFSFPIFLIQIWKFIAPGLYSNEKKAILPFMIATPVLFLLGAFLAYQFIMPLAIKFFLSFESLTSQTSMPIQLEAKVSEYLSLIMIFMIAFGLSFELPVLLILLATVGFVDSKYLSERRRYIIVIIFIVAAIITPPDPISQIGLAIPLMLLYEISILIIKYLEKNKNDNT
jgi:sec-independent protein translocase protein TatC